MSDTLRDQLLGLGFKPSPKPERPEKTGGSTPNPGRKPGQTSGRPGAPGPSRGPQHERSKGAPGGANRDARHRDRGPQAAAKPGAQADTQRRKPRSQEEIDLAKAYAIRAQREKEERIEAERVKQEEARKRREAKAKLVEWAKDKALNDPNAEIARHFPYGGKIKRIYVNEDQLKRLNAGELGVIQIDGRYSLVTAEALAEAEAIFAAAVALKVDPNAPIEDDPYADPKYKVPDDLVW